MAFDEKKQALVQESINAEEVVEKAAKAGIDLSLEQAQKMIDSFSMVEIDEDDFDKITGGDKVEDVCREAGKDGKSCFFCQSTETIFLCHTIDFFTGHSMNLCKNCGQTFYAYGNHPLPVR